MLLRQLRQAAASGHARYRRHLRCRAWPSAVVAVQCALRRAAASCQSCYDTATDAPSPSFCGLAKPVRRGVRGHLRRIIAASAHIGRRPGSPSERWSLWPREVLDWCEDNGLDYVFGLSGNKIPPRRRFRGRRYSHSPRVENRYSSCAAMRNELRRQIMESRAPRLRRIERRNSGSTSATSSPTRQWFARHILRHALLRAAR